MLRKYRLAPYLSALGVSLTVAGPAAMAQATTDAATPSLGTPALDRYVETAEPVNDTETPLRYGITIAHVHDDFWEGLAYGSPTK